MAKDFICLFINKWIEEAGEGSEAVLKIALCRALPGVGGETIPNGLSLSAAHFLDTRQRILFP